MDNLFSIFNLLALISYILVKELVLDKKNLKKELHDERLKTEQDRLREDQQKGPLKALEVDLGRLSQKVINLEDAIGDQAEVLGAKLDMILEDFKEKHSENRKELGEIRKDFTTAHRELSERLAAVENELKRPKRK